MAAERRHRTRNTREYEEHRVLAANDVFMIQYFGSGSVGHDDDINHCDGATQRTATTTTTTTNRPPPSPQPAHLLDPPGAMQCVRPRAASGTMGEHHQHNGAATSRVSVLLDPGRHVEKKPPLMARPVAVYAVALSVDTVALLGAVCVGVWNHRQARHPLDRRHAELRVAADKVGENLRPSLRDSFSRVHLQAAGAKVTGGVHSGWTAVSRPRGEERAPCRHCSAREY